MLYKIKKVVLSALYCISKTVFSLSVSKSDLKEKILALKGKHQGQRCFIIGNGPSLKVEDLDKLLLHNEISFASNYISQIFSQTNWRPTYYSVMDDRLQRNPNNVISKTTADIKFFRSESYLWTRKVHGICIWLNAVIQRKFSEDITSQIYFRSTITYALIQIAVYMGFKEIYLIGMDNIFAKTMNRDGTIVENKGIQSHFYKQDKYVVGSAWEMNIAYGAAKEYADIHGIKIINATRGGQLEVFPRVDFDLLFK